MKNHRFYSIAVLLCLFFFSSFLNAQNVNSNSPVVNATSNVPAFAVSATVEIWGAGGAGGGSTSNNSSGAGGGGGAYSARVFAVVPGQEIT